MCVITDVISQQFMWTPNHLWTSINKTCLMRYLCVALSPKLPTLYITIVPVQIQKTTTNPFRYVDPTATSMSNEYGCYNPSGYEMVAYLKFRNSCSDRFPLTKSRLQLTDLKPKKPFLPTKKFNTATLNV